MSDIPEQWYGHAPKVKEVVTYTCADCGRELRKTAQGFVHEPRHGYRIGEWDESVFRKERKKVAAAKATAEARPYAGAIKQCQAEVWPNDRGATGKRCENRARFAVHGTHNPADTIAVCAKHVEGMDRYQPLDWQRSIGYKGADEQVEEEYR